MDVMEAIKTRRSIGKVKPDPVPREKIDKILEAGIWAPNHHRTEPWRFFVLTGEGRRALGKVLVEIAKEGMDDPTEDENRKKLQRTEAKPLRAPVIITVGVVPSNQTRVIEVEEYAAVHAGVQNMLLVAHAMGLGAIWRTGKPCYHEKMNELFDLPANGGVAGFIYLGYPDMSDPKASRKKTVEDVTVWLDN